MQLTYRGTQYEYNQSPLEVRENDVLLNRGLSQRCKTLQEARYPLSYRGVSYTTDQVVGLSTDHALQTAQNLFYRGASYLKHPNGSVEVLAAGKTVRVRVPAVSELSSVHTAHLRRNLERRLQSAKEQGDQHLITLLEAESKELAL